MSVSIRWYVLSFCLPCLSVCLVWMYVCLVYLSVCLVWMYVCLVYLSVCLIWMYVLYIGLSVLSGCMSCIFVCLSYLDVCLVYVSICLIWMYVLFIGLFGTPFFLVCLVSLSSESFFLFIYQSVGCSVCISVLSVYMYLSSGYISHSICRSVYMPVGLTCPFVLSLVLIGWSVSRVGFAGR